MSRWGFWLDLIWFGFFLWFDGGLRRRSLTPVGRELGWLIGPGVEGIRGDGL